MTILKSWGPCASDVRVACIYIHIYIYVCMCVCVCVDMCSSRVLTFRIFGSHSNILYLHARATGDKFNGGCTFDSTVYRKRARAHKKWEAKIGSNIGARAATVEDASTAPLQRAHIIPSVKDAARDICLHSTTIYILPLLRLQSLSWWWYVIVASTKCVLRL
jgi:hypothetical protein